MCPTAGSTQPPALKRSNCSRTVSSSPQKLPVVLFADGTVLVDPELEVLAGRVGLRVQAAQDFYDLVVVGAGPAGLAAAVYGASEGLSTVVIEPEAPGGRPAPVPASKTTSASRRASRARSSAGAHYTQASRFGAEFVTQRATGMRVDGQYRFIQLADGREVSSHACCLPPASSTASSIFPAADRLTGCGIYYGAALVEALACKGEEVYIVGGANSAGQAALHFAKYAAKVTMLVRGEGLSATMSKYLIDEISRTSNIVVEARTQVLEAMGDERLQCAKVAQSVG